MRKIKILLIEDNRIVRDGIKAIIDEQADLSIVGASGGNHGILKQARSLKPRIVLLDIGLRNDNGLHVVRTLRKNVPHTKVIGMGLIPSPQDIIEFIRGGAAGFILKDASMEDFLDTIRTVARGVRILPPLLTGSLFTHVVNSAVRHGTLADAVRMTHQEREIIALIAGATRKKDIARRLNLSTYALKSHMHNILEKLALHSRLEVVTPRLDKKQR